MSEGSVKGPDAGEAAAAARATPPASGTPSRPGSVDGAGQAASGSDTFVSTPGEAGGGDKATGAAPSASPRKTPRRKPSSAQGAVGASGSSSSSTSRRRSSVRRSLAPATAAAAVAEGGDESPATPAAASTPGTTPTSAAATRGGAGGTVGAPGGGEDEDGDTNVKVVCRFRPQNAKEKARSGKLCVQFSSDAERRGCMIPLDDGGTLKFNFDRVFDTETKQSEVYEFAARSVVKALFKGYNGTIFAYGQTGSGKTYTMGGPDVDDPHLRGIVPRMVSTVFDDIEDADENIEFTVTVSMVEIYQERVRDLLDPSKDNLQVKEEKDGDETNIYIAGVTEVFVTEPTHIYDVLKAGASSRAVASTAMNDESSRSHSVFMLTLSQVNNETHNQKTGKLYLVDLAGSEKVRKTGAEGQALKEAQKINSSLSALGNVINALTDGKSTHVPYRDSKLTRLLQNALGGNSKTTLVVCCSPSMYNKEETISTLRFGKRAKRIKNTPKMNVERSAEELKVLLQLRDAEIARLKSVIKRLRGGEDVPVEAPPPSAAAGRGRRASGAPSTPTSSKAYADLEAKLKASEDARNEVEKQLQDLVDQFVARVQRERAMAAAQIQSDTTRIEFAKRRLETELEEAKQAAQDSADQLSVLKASAEEDQRLRGEAESALSRLKAELTVLRSQVTSQGRAAAARVRSVRSRGRARSRGLSASGDVVVGTGSPQGDKGGDVGDAGSTAEGTGDSGSVGGEALVDATSFDIDLVNELATLVRQQHDHVQEQCSVLEQELEKAEARATAAVASATQEKAENAAALASLRATITEKDNLLGAAQRAKSMVDDELESTLARLMELGETSREQQGQISSLTREVKAAEDGRIAAEGVAAKLKEVATERGKANTEFDARVSTLQAELDSALQALEASKTEAQAAGSAADSAQSALDAAKEEMEMLKAHLAATENKATSAEAAAERLSAEKDAADEELGKRSVALSAAEERVASMAAKLEEEEAEVTRLREIVEKLPETLTEAREDAAAKTALEWTEKVHALEERHRENATAWIEREREILKDTEEVRAALSRAEETVAARDGELAKSRKELEAAQVHHEGVSGEIDAVKAEAERAAHAQSELRETVDRLRGELATANERIAELRTESVALHESLANALAERDACAKETAEAEFTINLLQENLKAAEALVHISDDEEEHDDTVAAAAGLPGSPQSPATTARSEGASSAVDAPTTEAPSDMEPASRTEFNIAAAMSAAKTGGSAGAAALAADEVAVTMGPSAMERPDVPIDVLWEQNFAFMRQLEHYGARVMELEGKQKDLVMHLQSSVEKIVALQVTVSEKNEELRAVREKASKEKADLAARSDILQANVSMLQAKHTELLGLLRAAQSDKELADRKAQRHERHVKTIEGMLNAQARGGANGAHTLAASASRAKNRIRGGRKLLAGSDGAAAHAGAQRSLSTSGSMRRSFGSFAAHFNKSSTKLSPLQQATVAAEATRVPSPDAGAAVPGEDSEGDTDEEEEAVVPV